MAKPQGVIPSPEAWTEIVDTVRHTRVNRPVRKARRSPRRRNVGGGGDECLTVYELQTGGTVSGGTVVLNVTIDNGTSSVGDTITIDWNESASGALTAFEAHSDIASGDIAVKGGPFPDGALYIVFLSTGNLNRYQALPTINTFSFTGTNPKIKLSYASNADWEA